MLKDTKYVPVLRWKQAERSGLSVLYDDVKPSVTPCFELVMPTPKLDEKRNIIKTSGEVLKERIPDIIKHLNKCYSGISAFIDVHLIANGDLRVATLKSVLDNAKVAKTNLVPVTHIFPITSSDADMEVRELSGEYAIRTKSGLCIRIDRHNIGDENLSEAIYDFIHKYNLSTENIDIMVDLGLVQENDNAQYLASKLKKIKQIKDCRSFIITCGAFPPDLTDIQPYDVKQINRTDWELFTEIRKELHEFNPIFSDYTIQHPAYSEPIPGSNTSASIRYASESFWQIHRGKGLWGKKTPGFAQYPAHAKLIVADKVFKGEPYSAGDAYIAARAASDNKKTGNPTTWLAAGINHHMTLVVKQLTNQP